MHTYSTFKEAVCDMRDRGYTNTFSIQNQQIFCPELDKTIEPEKITLVEQHHVSANVPAGERDVYGFRTEDNKLGLMTSTYAEYDPEGFEHILRRCRR